MSEIYFLRPDTQIARLERLRAHRKHVMLANNGVQLKRKGDENSNQRNPKNRMVRREMYPPAQSRQRCHVPRSPVTNGHRTDMPLHLDEWKGRALGIEDELIDTINWVADQHRSQHSSAPIKIEPCSSSRASTSDSRPARTRHHDTQSPMPYLDHDSKLPYCSSPSDAASPDSLFSCSGTEVTHVSLADIEEWPSSVPEEVACEEVIAIEVPGSMLRFSTQGYGDWGALQSAVLDMTAF